MIGRTHLVLTATIDPGGMEGLRHRDPTARLREYEDAFRACLRNPDVPCVVFCENSGQSLRSIHRIAEIDNPWGKSVTVHSFDGNRNLVHRGKGAGEIRILEHVLAHSPEWPAADLLVKLTGRLRVKNLGRLCQLLQTEQSHSVFCDLRGNLQWADSRLFACTVGFMREHLLPLQDLIDDSRGITFEHVLARAVHHAMVEGQQWSMLPATPWLAGRSATTNERYPDSWIARWRRESFRRIKAESLRR
jgi:hypothetical protein